MGYRSSLVLVSYGETDESTPNFTSEPSVTDVLYPHRMDSKHYPAYPGMGRALSS